MSAKKPTNFEQGYICAVSNLIGGHGANTEAWDTFLALGIPLKTVLAWPDLCEYDIDNLQELKSFDKARP